jgi:hypothetical protein
LPRGVSARYRFDMLLFNRIVLNRHIVRQIYRLIFKPKFWRREFSPQTLEFAEWLAQNKHKQRPPAQGPRPRADPP